VANKHARKVRLIDYRNALYKTGGNISHTALILGVHNSAVYDAIQRDSKVRTAVRMGRLRTPDPETVALVKKIKATRVEQPPAPRKRQVVPLRFNAKTRNLLEQVAEKHPDLFKVILETLTPATAIKSRDFTLDWVLR
jgi:hypothetical protein